MIRRKKPPLWHLTADGKRQLGPPQRLIRVTDELRGRVDCHGDASLIHGNVSGLSGNVSAIRGDVTDTWGAIHESLSGDVSFIRGNISTLSGDVSALTKDLTFS